MFWFSLLILMIVVAAAPGISMYIEARRMTAAGRESGEGQPGDGSQSVA